MTFRRSTGYACRMREAKTLQIVADLNGRRTTRDEVLCWEDQRISAATRKLGIQAPASGDIAHRREAFLQEKLTLGYGETRRRLRLDDALSGAIAKFEAKLSPKRRFSVTDLYVPTGSAAEFVAFYWDCVGRNDELELLRACPDHFVQRIAPDGHHEVVETTGGSPMATRFVIDYKDVAGIVTPVDFDFPEQLTGVAYADGVAIGGVRHQFRNTADGFRARLTVEFPLATLGRMIAGHRWHLACEFSNWIESAVAAG